MIDAGAIVFDMDGLMVDSEPLWCEVEGDLCRARGGVWTEELARRCIGQGLPNSLRVMRDELGLAVDPERDVAVLVEGFVSRVGSLALKPGCRELVLEARGKVPIAVGSSSTKRLIETVLARFELLPLFDAVVSGECVARPKPAPDIFLECARRLRVPPARCVVLEDSLAGVTAALAADMKVIAVPEAEPERYAHAHAVVRDLLEARALIRI